MHNGEFWTVVATSATISAVLGAVLKSLGDKWVFDRKLEREYEQKERAELRALIGRYQARMVEAAVDWDRRMMQLYSGEHKHMHPGADGRRDHRQYLYQSVVFRFLSLLSLARRFEAEAFYIKYQIAKEEETEFLKYAKSFVWSMTYSDLTPEDGIPGQDHFRNDAFRPMLDVSYQSVEGIPETHSGEHLIFEWRRYRALIDGSANVGEDYHQEIEELLAFFDGLCPYEESAPPRRRWQRLVCLHLLVLGFMCTFAYEWQRNIDLSVREAIAQLGEDVVVIDAFLQGSRQLGLNDQDSFRHIRASLIKYRSGLTDTKGTIDLRDQVRDVDRAKT